LVLLVACGPSTDSPVAADPLAATVQDLPDWSGWWVVARGPGGKPGGIRAVRQNLEVYQPEARRLIEETKALGTNRSGAYCRPSRFVGDNGGFIDDVEFLLMPHRLTITNEDGLLRRIPIDGRSLRENPEPSNGGTSVGEWVGDTLVIETIGLHPDTTFPNRAVHNPQIGENVHTLERIQLNAQDQLVIDTVLTAPQLLKEPAKFTTVYIRDPGHIYRDHDVCSSNDRSIDPETGLERFDMTPPADLPPPPN
jgi:hypothetical protein